MPRPVRHAATHPGAGRRELALDDRQRGPVAGQLRADVGLAALDDGDLVAQRGHLARQPADAVAELLLAGLLGGQLGAQSAEAGSCSPGAVSQDGQRRCPRRAGQREGERGCAVEGQSYRAPTGLAVGLALLRATPPSGGDSPRRPGSPAFPPQREIRRGDLITPRPRLSCARERRRDPSARAGSAGGLCSHLRRCLAGSPRAAGAVLHKTDDPTLPWHRIVRADGSLAKGKRQRAAARGRGGPVSRLAG